MIQRITTIAVVACLLAVAPLAAQKNPQAGSIERPPERLYRGGVGVMAGTGGLGLAIDLSMHSAARLYRLRFSVQDNAAGNMGGGPSERFTITETAFMVGRGRPVGRGYGSISAGAAIVGVDRHEDPPEEATTIGVPLEAQLISGGPLRIGATLAGNLNLERSFAAFILSLQIGRVP